MHRRILPRSILGVAVFAAITIPSVGLGQVEKSRHFTEDAQVAILQAVVRVRVHVPGNTGCRGSAVCIGTDADGCSYLLTCYHVMRHAERAGAKLSFETFTGKSYPNPNECFAPTQFQLWTEPKWDLALIRVQATVPKSVRLCHKDRKLRKGDALLDVGCGKGAPPVCQIGKFVGLDKKKDLLFSRGGVGGRSGGLLYARGGMVGVHARGGEGQSSAVSFRKIHRFLQNCGIEGQVPINVDGKKLYQVVRANDRT